MATKTLEREETQDAPAEVSKAHDYSLLIEEYLARMREANEDRKTARDPRAQHEAITRLEQFKLAIDNAREAEHITDEAAQFGKWGNEFSFRLPPCLDEYAQITPQRQSSGRRYFTTDPLEIAWLRRLVREGQLQEVEVGLYCCVPATGIGRVLWQPYDVYIALLEGQQINP